MERFSSALCAGLIGLAALPCVSACSADSGSTISPPDLDVITVFYPDPNGVVNGRGLPGAFPVNVSHVSVSAQPTDTNTIQEVAPDGSFTFSLVALSGDVLEIAGASDGRGNDLGRPVYIEVPKTPLPAVDAVCCFELGTCYTKSERDNNAPCRDPLTGATECTDDLDCGVDEGEYIQVRLDRINITKPNERGRIDVTGVVTPNALLEIENRALTGAGIDEPRFRTAQITSDIGAFELRDLKAKGDDEIVLKVRDLNGYTSPWVSQLVPDADLVGLDVLGVFAWEPLTNGQTGPIVVMLSPWGTDGRGICPDTEQAPEVCYSGGLTHEMVTLRRAQMNVNGSPENLLPTRSSTSADRPHVRGAEGNVRAGPLDVVLVVDTSAEAAAKDGPTPRRFDAARDFVIGLRDRDRVGLVTYDSAAAVQQPGNPGDPTLVEADARDLIINRIDGLGTGGGGSDPFGAVQAAAQLLRDNGSSNGRIVIIAGAGAPVDRTLARSRYESALTAVSEDLLRGFREVPVDFVLLDVPPDSVNFEYIRDLAVFSKGRVYHTNSAGLGQTMTNARSFLSGSFLLLYDIQVPVGVGKSGIVDLEVEVQLNGISAQATYQGPLLIQNSSN